MVDCNTAANGALVDGAWVGWYVSSSFILFHKSASEDVSANDSVDSVILRTEGFSIVMVVSFFVSAKLDFFQFGRLIFDLFAYTNKNQEQNN